jgi:hypothetical protein
MPQPIRRRSARIRPYLEGRATPPAPPATAMPVPLPVLHRVLAGLHALFAEGQPQTPPTPPRDTRSPLVRFIDAERARTVADRTPTVEIPVVTDGGLP